MAGYWKIAAKVFGRDPRQATGDLGTNTFNDIALLGLAKGPIAFPPVLHANSFGAHIAYGLATAGATQQLENTL